jgi:pre-mRNA cleavage complex 2 protein Pcf11
MSYGVSSDEVAEDYRKALEDLTMNSRYEISNLTVIAKENTEHALAISEALKNHIKRVRTIKSRFLHSYCRLDLYLV